MRSYSLRESRFRAAYPGRHILQPVATSSFRDGVFHACADLLAPRDGSTKFGNRVGSNPLDFFFGVGSSSARAVDFSIFSVRTLHSAQNQKDEGSIPMRLLDRVILRARATHHSLHLLRT